MGEIIIKKENGKDVAYERDNIFGDRRVGELKTHSPFRSSNITLSHDIDISSSSGMEREGSVDGREGKFISRSFGSRSYYQFVPNAEDNNSSESSPESSIDNYVNSGSDSSHSRRHSGGSSHESASVNHEQKSRMSPGLKYALFAELIGIFSESFGARLFMASSQLYEREGKYPEAVHSAERAGDVDRAILLYIRDSEKRGEFYNLEQFAKDRGLEKKLLQAYKENHIHLRAAEIAAKLELVDDAAEQYSIAIQDSETPEIKLRIFDDAIRFFYDIYREQGNSKYLKKFCIDGIKFTRHMSTAYYIVAEQYYAHLLKELQKKV